MVSERGLEVLRVIVQDYVATREPVGSKSIVERHSFGVSAATIRNDMAMLEEEELIAAPHTSSGRVPTDKGYRLFVDQLTDLRPLTAPQRQAIETFLGESADLDEVLSRTVRLLSQLTHQVAVVQYPSLSAASIRHIELVPLGPSRLMTVLITDSGRVEQRVVETAEPFDPVVLGDLRTRLNASLDGLALPAAVERLQGLVSEHPTDHGLVARVASALVEQVLAHRQDRLILGGTANLARTERDFRGSIYPVLEAIEEQVALLRLFAEMELDPTSVTTSIGRENEEFGLQETSVVTTGYSTGTTVARVGVLGPLRMDYSTNMAAVRAVARYLSRLLGEE